MGSRPPLPLPPHMKDSEYEVVLRYDINPKQIQDITSGDRRRLENGRWFNSTLMDYGIQREVERVKEEDARRADHEKVNPLVHVFNSFFYSTLCKGKQTQEAARNQRFAPYTMVENWTKKLDLFEKKYILMVIHESLHWYLAAIVNPKWIIDNAPKKRPLDEGYGRNGVPATGTRTSMVSNSSDPNLANRCWIFTFDSLGGKHDNVVENLKKYIDMEAKTKKGKEWTAANEVKGIAVKVPQQQNTDDCGPYVFYFLEKFLANPLEMTKYIVAQEFPQKSIKGDTEDIWKTEEAKSKRRIMREEMDDLIENYSLIKLQNDAKGKKPEEREKEKQAKPGQRTTLPSIPLSFNRSSKTSSSLHPRSRRTSISTTRDSASKRARLAEDRSRQSTANFCDGVWSAVLQPGPV
ncbi:hypothetical protein JCM5350_004108 [Sporobolomyces pararoseus]